MHQANSSSHFSHSRHFRHLHCSNPLASSLLVEEALGLGNILEVFEVGELKTEVSKGGQMKWLKNNKGFSLIEAVLSTMILSIGLMGGVLLMQNATVASVNSDFQAIASQLANEKLETILADNYMTDGKYSIITNGNYPAENLGYGTQDNVFQRSVSITEVDEDLSQSQAGSGLKKVDVTVSWGENLYERITISTLVSDYN